MCVYKGVEVGKEGEDKTTKRFWKTIAPAEAKLDTRILKTVKVK